MHVPFLPLPSVLSAIHLPHCAIGWIGVCLSVMMIVDLWIWVTTPIKGRWEATTEQKNMIRNFETLGIGMCFLVLGLYFAVPYFIWYVLYPLGNKLIEFIEDRLPLWWNDELDIPKRNNHLTWTFGQD